MCQSRLVRREAEGKIGRHRQQAWIAILDAAHPSHPPSARVLIFRYTSQSGVFTITRRKPALHHYTLRSVTGITPYLSSLKDLQTSNPSLALTFSFYTSHTYNTAWLGTPRHTTHRFCTYPTSDGRRRFGGIPLRGYRISPRTTLRRYDSHGSDAKRREEKRRDRLVPCDAYMASGQFHVLVFQVFSLSSCRQTDIGFALPVDP